MKIAKTEVANADFKMWCEHCCIRIAPQGERTVLHGKAYHPQCYSKAFPGARKAKA